MLCVRSRDDFIIELGVFFWCGQLQRVRRGDVLGVVLVCLHRLLCRDDCAERWVVGVHCLSSGGDVEIQREQLSAVRCRDLLGGD